MYQYLNEEHSAYDPQYSGVEYNNERPSDREDFYEKSGSSTDKFGYQGERYPHGDYGDMYEQGPSAADKLGMYPDDPGEKLWEKDDSFEIIDESAIENFEPIARDEKGWKQYHPFIVLFLIIVLYVAFELWATASQKFIFQYVHNGSKVGWQKMTQYAGAVTLFFIAVTWILEVPLWIFE